MRMTLPCSLIVTVRNEEHSLPTLLGSILAQSHAPREVCIVDAHSTDNTWALLSEYVSLFSDNGIHLRLFRHAGNRSAGRNFAMKQVTYDHVCVTDAGCVLDEQWCYYLMHDFRGRGVRSGWYEPAGDSPFQRAMACYTCSRLDTLDSETFLPSSRSVACDVATWKAVGGYPEELDTCEDLIFARRLRLYTQKNALPMICVPQAYVKWVQVDTWKKAWNQLHGYAVGDGQAGYMRWQVPFIYARYAIGLALFGAFLYALTMQSGAVGIIGFTIFMLLIAYTIWAVWKNERYVSTWKEKMYLILLQYMSDWAVMTGYIRGFIHRIMRHHAH